MKILFLLGAAAVASAPLLHDGEGEAGEKSCCATTTCDTAPASLASAFVALPETTYDPDSTGSITIRARFKGDTPERMPDLVIDAAKSDGCEAVAKLDKADRTRLVAKDGSVANVVVTCEIEGQKPEPPTEPVVLDQVGCRFEPHIAVLPVGGRIRFNNSDKINHNVHTFAKKNSALNRNIAGRRDGLPASSEEQRLDKDETIEVKCDIHPWMRCFVIVTDAARYNVTKPDGTTTLTGLPPGEYKVKYWHESLGKGTSASVTVTAGGATELVIELSAEAKKKGRRRR